MASIKKYQTGGQTRSRLDSLKKSIEEREKRIAARDSANQRKSYTNERANRVVGKYEMGGKIIRANKGSGKKPTAAMLKQERKIKAKTKK